MDAPMRRALKLKWDLSMEMSGSLVLPTSRKGTEMSWSGMTKRQNDSTMSSLLDTNSNPTCNRGPNTSTYKQILGHNFVAFFPCVTASTVLFKNSSACTIMVKDDMLMLVFVSHWKFLLVSPVQPFSLSLSHTHTQTHTHRHTHTHTHIMKSKILFLTLPLLTLNLRPLRMQPRG